MISPYSFSVQLVFPSGHCVGEIRHAGDMAILGIASRLNALGWNFLALGNPKGAMEAALMEFVKTSVQ
jgi:hypothetical protein